MRSPQMEPQSLSEPQRSSTDKTDAINAQTAAKEVGASNDDPTDSAYNPQSPAFWLVIAFVYLAFFLIALDRMIIATAIPAITNTFSSISDIGWYGSGYMLTCAIFNPMFGSIYRHYDIKTVFIISIVIFEVGSVVCGAAPTSTALIVGRAIAGIGAAGISSGAIMVIVNLVPLHKRPVYTSFFGMAFGVSSVLGPLIGGIFADSKSLTWRWCFYINLPIGGATILSMLFFLRLPSPPQKRQKLSTFQQIKQLDPLGVLFLVPSMVCLILALQWGGTTYAWSAPKIIALLVIFAITLIAFIIVEFTLPDTAMAPSRVVLQRSVGASLLFMFMLSGGMMCAIYYLSVWFQAAQGQSAMQAGVRTIPLVLSMVLFGIVLAIITQKIGYYVPALILSPILAATATGLLSTLKPDSSSAAWIGYQILYGIGLGAGAQTSSLAAQTVLKREDVPLGTAMGFFMQQLGGAVFLAVGQNIFSSQLVAQLPDITGLDKSTIINTGATDLKRVVPANELDTVINAYSYALTRVFLVAAGLSAAMIICALSVEWRSIKKNKARPDESKKGANDEEKQVN